MIRGIAIAVVCAAGGAAHAQALLIDVVGTPGSGTTSWTFSGNGVAAVGGTVRTNDAAGFNGMDTGQFSFVDDVILSALLENVVFDLTGDAQLTIGSTTESITGLFFDDDGLDHDDFGVRVANELVFLDAETTSWSGSGTAAVDISNFALGSWSINAVDGQRMFIAEEVIVTFSIPAPGSAGVLLGAGLLAFRRRR